MMMIPTITIIKKERRSTLTRMMMMMMMIKKQPVQQLCWSRCVVVSMMMMMMMMMLVVTVAGAAATTTTITWKQQQEVLLFYNNEDNNYMMKIRGGGGGTIGNRNHHHKPSTTTTTKSPAVGSVISRRRHNNNNNNNNQVTDSRRHSRRTTGSSSRMSGTGTATMTNEIFNVIKGIVGVGVLTLPAGIAQFGDHPSALVPALLLIAGIGLLSAYGFAIIGKVCAYTQATSYQDAWSKSVHPSTSWIPAVSATMKTFLACLALSMVLADTFVGLLQPWHMFRTIGSAEQMRTTVLLGITTFILLPLCWMKNLTALAPFSLLGVLGMVFTAMAMTIRYFDQSYSSAVVTAATTAATTAVTSPGQFYTHIPVQYRPNFGTAGYKSVLQPKSLILVCMLSTAYMAHFNAPKFYHELYNNTLPRFHTVVASSFGISILMMGYITAIGFLTFGNAASGLVLNNYSSMDRWMSTSRIAVAMALVFSYPLAFQGCRDGMIDVVQLIRPKVQRTTMTLNVMTIVLLVLLTALAATLKDVSFVLALGGATLGNALTYLYPAIMYAAIVKKQNRTDQSTGVFIAKCSAVMGVIMGIIGAKMALEK